MIEYEIQVKGTQGSPLLMHCDNIEWADEMETWRKVSENKKRSKAGDDRTPAWMWMGALYHDGEHLAIPHEVLMAALLRGGALVPTGKGQRTFKAQTQSGIIPVTAHFKLQTSTGLVSLEDVWKLRKEESFSVHTDYVKQFGFRLFVKRARIGQSKHVRVRPRFDEWSFSARVAVIDDAITEEVLKQILDQAGVYVGLCDWRPGSKTPGPYGRFEAAIEKV